MYYSKDRSFFVIQRSLRSKSSTVFNELEEVDRKNEYAQTTDHYAGALELKMKVGLRLVMVTQKWPNNLYRIQRTSIQEERLLRLGEPDTVEENLIPKMVIEPEEGRLETQRNEVPEAAVMVDKWRSVIRSAMELKITLKAMASGDRGVRKVTQIDMWKKGIQANDRCVQTSRLD